MTQLTTYTVPGTQFQTSDLLRAISKAKTTATRKEPGKVMQGNSLVASVTKQGKLSTF